MFNISNSPSLKIHSMPPFISGNLQKPIRYWRSFLSQHTHPLLIKKKLSVSDHRQASKWLLSCFLYFILLYYFCRLLRLHLWWCHYWIIIFFKPLFLIAVCSLYPLLFFISFTLLGRAKSTQNFIKDGRSPNGALTDKCRAGRWQPFPAFRLQTVPHIFVLSLRLSI